MMLRQVLVARKNTRRKRGGQGKKNKQTRKRARQEKKGIKFMRIDLM